MKMILSKILITRYTAFIFFMLVFAAAVEAADRKIYFFIDDKGVTHYTDTAEDGLEGGYDVGEIDEFDENHEDDVLLTYDAVSQEVLIENRLYSPITVILKASDESAVDTDIEFDKIFQVQGNTVVSLGHIYVIDNTKEFTLTREFSIGTPTVVEQLKNDEFLIPFKGRYRVTQAHGGKFSHKGPKNRYAVDISMPVGTPLYAAKDGKIVDMKMHFTKAGLDPAAHGKANYIRISHSDGTMTIYVHLKANSQVVKLGQYVKAGDLIAQSGNTGYTTGPHLHFAVQHNNGVSIVSIPFKFKGGIVPKAGSMLGN
jgi:murein DD-endopeptidase MepM/ murein hydrolase activator NlpD